MALRHDTFLLTLLFAQMLQYGINPLLRGFILLSKHVQCFTSHAVLSIQDDIAMNLGFANQLT